MTHYGFVLAAFVSPALFFGGAAAVAAPILIHLLARRRFKRIRWAAMEFLIHAERHNRRRLRMEEWILLALRCLVILLIAAMVARPFFNPTGIAALGGAKRTERVFLLDDSFSMGYESADGSPFARAKHAIRRVLDAVRREAPDDTVTIIRMTAPREPVDAGTFLSDTQAAELYERLEALTPSQRSIHVPTVLTGVVDVLERSPDITNIAVYVISDFQRVDWMIAAKADSTSNDTASIFAPLAEWANENRGLRTVLIDVGEDEPFNTAIAEVTIVDAQLVAGTTSRARATMVNHSPQARDDVTIDVRVGNLAQTPMTIDELAPYQTATTDLEIELLRTGYDSIRIALPPDSLPIDNTRFLSVDVVGAIRVLVVNGEPSPDTYDDEVTFLTTALRPEGQVFSGNEILIVDETELDEANLSTFHLVVLANVYRLSEPAIESLELFVRRGGGVVVFLGDQVDPTEYNTALYRDGRGLLPAELIETRTSADAVHLIITDRLHPTMRGLGGTDDPLGIGTIPFFTFVACAPMEGSDDLDSAKQPAARVIARFDDADSSPAIVERAFGNGRVVLITTGADKEWHLWPDHPTFLPVVMELSRYAARQSGSQPSFRVGEPIEITLDAGRFSSDVLVRTPEYPNEHEVSVVATPADDGEGMVLRWEHTDRAGVYQFVLQSREGPEVVRYAAVNVDTRESDLTPAGEKGLRQAAGNVPIEYVRGIENLSATALDARAEFWRWCLIALAIVLMTEHGLAWFWGRRG